MPRVQPIQNSMNAGEWSPLLYGRTDIDKWKSACRLLRNWVVLPQGGIMRRPGTRYVQEVKDSSAATRVYPFVFSDEQAYILEFGDRYIRIFRNEGILRLQTLSGIRSSNDISSTTSEFEVVGHGYRDGDGPVMLSTDDTLPAPLNTVDEYYIRTAPSFIIAGDSSEVDTTNNEFIVAAGHGLEADMGPFRISSTVAIPGGLDPDTDYYIVVVSATNFGVSENPGGGKVALSSTGTGTHTLEPTDEYVRNKFRLAANPTTTTYYSLTSAGSGLQTITPSAAIPDAIEVTTPYRTADVSSLAFAQSADTLYIVHPDYAPHKLERFSGQGFWLSEVDFIDGPYLDENTTDVTMQVSAVSGPATITITASEATFTASDVGRAFRLYGDDGGGVLHWGWAKITSVNPVTFTDADIESFLFSAAGVTTGSPGVITEPPGHGMDTGELVRFVDGGGGLPSPLAEGTDYYVRATSATTIQMYLTEDDAIADSNAIALTTTGGSSNRCTSSVIDIAAHGYSGGEGPVQLTNSGGALPSGYSTSTDYFIGYVSASSITLSETRGGTAVSAVEPTGGGLHTLHGDSVPQTTCNATVKSDFPNTSATTSWRLGAWSPDPNIGYPRGVTFHEQRLWFFANREQPQAIWGSKSADFETFSPTGDLTDEPDDLDDTVLDTSGITYTLGSNQVNVILWANSARTMLLGTSSAAWTASAAVESDAISPSNFKVRRSFQRGSSAVLPITVDNRTLYVSSTGKKLFSLGYSFESDDYLGEDLNLLAEHITKGGISYTDYAPEPWSQVVTVRADGVVPVLTLIREQEIAGWGRWELGGDGVVESVAVIPAPAGDVSGVGRVNVDHDQIWFVVRRTINGQTKRYVEFMEDHFESTSGADSGDDITDAFFVDSGLTYNSTATTSISGLDHLEGETVDALADGVSVQGLTVSSGAITLAESASKVHVGLPYNSDFRSLRLSLGDNEGTAQTKLGRLDHLVLRLDSSLGGEFGTDESHLDPLDEYLMPHNMDPGELAPPFSGDIEVPFDGEYDTENGIYVRQSKPLPFTVLALIPHGQRGGRGDRSRSGGR